MKNRSRNYTDGLPVLRLPPLRGFGMPYLIKQEDARAAQRKIVQGDELNQLDRKIIDSALSFMCTMAPRKTLMQ
jgi:hypothetical protein